VSRDANPVMTFPLKKRIYTVLLIDRMAALYVVVVAHGYDKLAVDWGSIPGWGKSLTPGFVLK